MHSRRTRSVRARTWLAAAAIAVGLPVTGWLFLLSPADKGRSAGQRPSGVAGVSAGPPAQPAPSSPVQIGVSVNRLFNDRTYTQAQIDAQLAAVAATGVRGARSDSLWEIAEPNAPAAGSADRYDWSFDDEIESSLRRHGLTWLPIIDYAPAWASSRPDYPHALPSDPHRFAAYAQALALRYDAPAYEIWNEPDNKSFAGPAPDPASYGTLYEVARAAILAVRPQARVLVGGLSHPLWFLPAMIKAHPEMVGHIDGVGIHPYAPNPGAVVAAVKSDRAMLDQLGLASTPLYATELGWTTSPPGAISYAPLAARPGYIARALTQVAHSGCGVAAEYLYTWITPRRSLHNSQDWFGISDSPLDVAALTRGVAAAASGEASPGAPSARSTVGLPDRRPEGCAGP